MPLKPASIATNNGTATATLPDPPPATAHLPGREYKPSAAATTAPETVTAAESARFNREHWKD